MKAYEIHAYCNTDMHATLIVANVCVISSVAFEFSILAHIVTH